MVKFLIRHAKAIVVAVGLLTFRLAFWPSEIIYFLGQKGEGVLIDYRYRISVGSIAQPHHDILLVGIENSTISLDTLAPEEIAASTAWQLMQQPWPWDRRVYAE